MLSDIPNTLPLGSMFAAGLFLAAISMLSPYLFASETGNSGETPLYETFELELEFTGVAGNKFMQFVSATFSQGGRSFGVDGFYDGGDTWRVRFMPDKTGVWTYNWSFNGQSGNGSFECTARVNPDNHGHVKRDPDHPRYLIHDDGTPNYFYGGMWFGIPPPNNVYPDGTSPHPSKGNDAQKLAYLDLCKTKRHNGSYLTINLYPLNDDKSSFDLPFVRRMDWFVKECLSRGIYVQIGFFNTWSRKRGSYTYTTDGAQHVFNVWAAGDETAKEFYLRYLIARAAGYANVYWELGNEMEHSPNPGSTFASLANSHYVPWIRQYDPYDLPIGVSEGIWTSINVDIGFLHQTNQLPPVNTNGNRVVIMNELVRGGVTGTALWEDPAIRGSSDRLSYRRTFWRMFTYGGTGSSEATHLWIDSPLNSAVHNVMDDQMRLRNFVEALPVNINEMNTDTAFVASGPGSYRTRRKGGSCYATYFLVNPGQSVSSGHVSVNLPSGDYQAIWYHPSTGQYSAPVSISATGGVTTLSHPAFTEDLVLRILAQNLTGTPTASIVADKISGEAPLTVQFDGSGSSDPDGTIVSYQWDFGDSSAASGAVVSHTFNAMGSYTVTLTVSDNEGKTGTHSQVITATAPDTQPPVIVKAEAINDPQQVSVFFSESLHASSATDATHYAIDHGISVNSISLSADGTTVTLNTSTLSESVTYTLTVNGVKDLAGNGILPNTQVSFVYATVDPDLVGHWKLDDGTGVAALDHSTHGNHGSVVNGPVWSSGKLGGALKFDGANDHVRVNDPGNGSLDMGSGQDFTLAAWIKTGTRTPNNGDSLRIISKQVSGGNLYTLRELTDGKINLTVRSNGTLSWLTGTSAVDDNNWHHVAGIRRNGTLMIFVDGVAQGSTSSNNGDLSSSEPLYLGSFRPSEQNFNGLLDDVRIYKRALSDHEIASLAQVSVNQAPAIDSAPWAHPNPVILP